MNTTPLNRGALALAIALLVSTGGAAFGAAIPKPSGYFTRAAVAYVDPNEPGMDSGFGVFAQLGAAYDAGEFSIEVGQMRFDQSETLDLGDGYIADVQADLRVTPLMFSGRYGAQFGTRKQITVRFGAAAGVADMRASGHAALGEISGGLTTSETVAAYAGDITFAWALSEKLELSAAYRYMVAQGTDWDVAGYEIEIDDLKMNVFSLALAYRW